MQNDCTGMQNGLRDIHLFKTDAKNDHKWVQNNLKEANTKTHKWLWRQNDYKKNACMMTEKGCKTWSRMNFNIVAGCYTADFSLFYTDLQEKCVVNQTVLDEEKRASYLIRRRMFTRWKRNPFLTNTLFSCLCARSYPSHLAIAGQEAVKSTEVAHDVLQGFPDNQTCQGPHSTHHCRATVSNYQPLKGRKAPDKLKLHQTFLKSVVAEVEQVQSKSLFWHLKATFHSQTVCPPAKCFCFGDEKR